MRRALISVTDKSGVVEFATGLTKLGFQILSTGGTAEALRKAGLTVTDVSEVTGFPEMLEGRIKTLHPMVHGGLLGDVRHESHRQQMASAGIERIEILCVNLYAFEKTVNAPHEFDQAIESIDIGGPAMIRAASKNWANVAVVTDPADYNEVVESAKGEMPDALRLRLSAKAFRHTAFYDSMIARYMSEAAGEKPVELETWTMGYRRELGLRYGENPHQTAGLYRDPLGKSGIPQAIQKWGKELSYNNILDSDAAWELVGDMPAGSCAIIKHGNPCGAALGESLGESYRIAKASDPVSAFGGIAAFHGAVDLATAEVMTEKGNFLEVIIATSFTEEAIAVFKDRSGWGQDVRLLEAQLPSDESYLTIRTIRGGALIQDSDEEPEHEWKVVTEAQPSEEDWKAIRLAWRMVPHVKSNAIVIGNHRQLLGVGAGQMNRVQSVRLALNQAGELAKGATLASDAFFPFPDSVETAAAEGVKCFVQPGGSKKDPDVIAKANELGVVMVLTGVRHFRH